MCDNSLRRLLTELGVKHATIAKIAKRNRDAAYYHTRHPFRMLKWLLILSFAAQKPATELFPILSRVPRKHELEGCQEASHRERKTRQQSRQHPHEKATPAEDI
jgi:hypothetical protein